MGQKDHPEKHTKPYPYYEPKKYFSKKIPVVPPKDSKKIAFDYYETRGYYKYPKLEKKVIYVSKKLAKDYYNKYPVFEKHEKKIIHESKKLVKGYYKYPVYEKHEKKIVHESKKLTKDYYYANYKYPVYEKLEKKIHGPKLVKSSKETKVYTSYNHGSNSKK